MGNFIGSTMVEVMGEQVDINDDARMQELLRLHSMNLLSGTTPAKAATILIDVLTDVQLVVVKLAFILNQCGLQGAQGVGIQTAIQLYDQLAKISGLSIKPEERPAIVGADGDVIESTREEIIEGSAPSVIEDLPPAAGDEL